jgi:hypothetical protein
LHSWRLLFEVRSWKLEKNNIILGSMYKKREIMNSFALLSNFESLTSNFLERVVTVAGASDKIRLAPDKVFQNRNKFPQSPAKCITIPKRPPLTIIRIGLTLVKVTTKKVITATSAASTSLIAEGIR